MNDSRIDRLYELLPVIYRMRDAEQGEPLKALLQIISEQVNLVEDDIFKLYENWFIETCEDWVVPYIGDLIGYEPVHESGEPSTGGNQQDQLRNKVLIPRREVANTIRYRRRKGTLALLELLSNDVAGWPARAVEFYQLLSWTQAINYQHSDRGKTLELRNGSALDLINGPFDTIAHTVDIRRINSNRSTGFFNIPSVSVFVWRLKSYSVTMTPAYCQQAVGNHCFTFSVLGNDSPLYVNPEPETDPTHIADEFNLPVPVRRSLLETQKINLYGKGKSLQIWLSSKRRNQTIRELVPPERIIAADLSQWRYLPPKGYVAVDPVLGRIVFPSRKPPGKCDVLVSYHYGFSTELGGGEYERPLSQLTQHKIYRVGAEEIHKTINAAIDQWRQEQAVQTQESELQKLRNAVVEIMDSGLYEEDFDIALRTGESLQIRAALGKRAVIGLSDKHRGRPESFSVQVGRGSCLILDGLIVVGRPVEITAIESSDQIEQTDKQATESGYPVSGPKHADIIIRHTTLVPGWEINADCSPIESTMASLKLLVAHLCVNIEHSIIGSIEVDPTVKSLIQFDNSELDPAAEEKSFHYRCRSIEKEVRLDPIRICISDSILDATDPVLEAIGTPDCPVGYAILTILRCTVFGQVQVHAIELAENCIFEGRITVARRQLGCIRFCYVTPESRTPRRYQCQPDLANKKIAEDLKQNAKSNNLAEPDDSVIQAAQEREANRVHPVFSSIRYGMPTYSQLAECCAEEIKRGTEDESEMGVYHRLYQPQRLANLRIRLVEYIPARMDAGIILSS
jgi:hypothetical protein